MCRTKNNRLNKHPIILFKLMGIKKIIAVYSIFGPISTHMNLNYSRLICHNVETRPCRSYCTVQKILLQMNG